MRIGDICEFKSGNEHADFWLIRKGGENVIGKPIKEYSPEYIGVTIIHKNVTDPGFMYYYFQYLQQGGIFKRLAHGTLNLKNISIADIKNIPFSFGK